MVIWEVWPNCLAIPDSQINKNKKIQLQAFEKSNKAYFALDLVGTSVFPAVLRMLKVWSDLFLSFAFHKLINADQSIFMKLLILKKDRITTILAQEGLIQSLKA